MLASKAYKITGKIHEENYV